MKSEPSFRGGVGGGEKGKAGTRNTEIELNFLKGTPNNTIVTPAFLRPISPLPRNISRNGGLTRFIPHRSCQFERERSNYSIGALFFLFLLIILSLAVYVCMHFSSLDVSTTSRRRERGKASRLTSRMRAPSKR